MITIAGCVPHTMLSPCSVCYLDDKEDEKHISPARSFLQKEGPRSSWQKEILNRECNNWMMKKIQTQRLVDAFTKAIGARFEYGECG